MKETDMSQRYRKFKRTWGTYYAYDNVTGNSVNQQPKCGLATEEFQGLKMLPPHVLDRHPGLRHVDIKVLRFQPRGPRVLNDLRSPQETPEDLIKLVFPHPWRTSDFTFPAPLEPHPCLSDEVVPFGHVSR